MGSNSCSSGYSNVYHEQPHFCFRVTLICNNNSKKIAVHFSVCELLDKSYYKSVKFFHLSFNILFGHFCLCTEVTERPGRVCCKSSGLLSSHYSSPKSHLPVFVAA